MRPTSIKHTLERIAEEGIPTNVDLWPRIQGQIQPMPDETPRVKSRQVLLFTGAAALTLIFLVFISPQGQAIADTIVQFFTATGGKEISLPTGDEYPAMSEVRTIEQAEDILGWEVRGFAQVPEGLTLSHIEYSLGGEIVRIVYTAVGGGGRVVLSQGPGEFPLDGDWESVPSDAIEAVSIGDAGGEYVQGGFAAQSPEDGEATWRSNLPMQRLRWTSGGMWFEIMKQGDPAQIEYLDKAGLIALAEIVK